MFFFLHKPGFTPAIFYKIMFFFLHKPGFTSTNFYKIMFFLFYTNRVLHQQTFTKSCFFFTQTSFYTNKLLQNHVFFFTNRIYPNKLLQSNVLTRTGFYTHFFFKYHAFTQAGSSCPVRYTANDLMNLGSIPRRAPTFKMLRVHFLGLWASNNPLPRAFVSLPLGPQVLVSLSTFAYQKGESLQMEHSGNIHWERLVRNAYL